MTKQREVVWRKPTELAIHADVRKTPELGEDSPEWAAMLHMTEARAEILTPLFINGEDEILDGRHRRKLALRCKIAEVPCIIIDDENDQAAIILDAICARRHYTKSARAYLALPLIEQAVAEGIARRASELRQGADFPKADKTRLREKKGSDELGERLGIGVDLMRLARHTASLFEDSDRALEKWRLSQPQEREAWEAAEAEGQTWMQWRAARLADMGENPADPSTAALIPESYREVYEAKLFEGEMALGAINKAVGSALITKGQVRSDLGDPDKGLHYTLLNKVDSWHKTMWRRWSELPVTGRSEVVARLSTVAPDWPKEVKLAVYDQLKRDLKR